MTRVYADMVADLFHHGHVNFLRQARALGDELVVGIHSDATVASYKNAPILTMDERARVVAACRYVDEVVTDVPFEVGPTWLDRHQIDLVVHGDDFDHEQLTAMYREPYDRGILRTVSYTAGISTTEILARLRARLNAEAGSP